MIIATEYDSFVDKEHLARLLEGGATWRTPLERFVDLRDFESWWFKIMSILLKFQRRLSCFCLSKRKEDTNLRGFATVKLRTHNGATDLFAYLL